MCTVLYIFTMSVMLAVLFLKDPRRNPRTPLDCARAQNPHSAISQYLEQAVNRVDLLLDALSLETNDVKIVKLLVCGDPEMGKTQFCRSLIRPPHFWSQNIYRLFGRATSLFNPSQRTPGINVENINIPGVGLMSMWDFAGHMQYYVSHSLFLGSVNAVFCVVTSLQKLRTEQEEYLRFWLEFIILARRSSNILAKENRRPVVIIIASHSDAPDRDRPLRGRQLREHLGKLTYFCDHFVFVFMLTAYRHKTESPAESTSTASRRIRC